MDKEDLIFTGAFIVALTLMVFFLGTSITGYFALTMHCEDGICKEMCEATTDCDAPETCCDKGNFGVCEETCEKEYELQPQLDIAPSQIPMKSPTPETNIVFYSVLAVLIIVIGAAYFSKRKKYIEKEQHL